MSERKVLNKYYPADYDPSKIPKGKRNKNATFNIRIMAPFNMRCNMCKEYIYKGKKFNSRKEDVMDETYLGLKIFRFYIKCPRCVSEIAFKTDLENTDYTLEAGAKRLFEAEKIAQQMAEEERKAKEEDEMNPMTMLENRTKQSRAEMDQIDSLEELREMNSRKNQVNTDAMIEKYRKYEEMLAQLQMEKEEEEIRDIFGASATKVVKRLNDSDSDEEGPLKKKFATASTSSSKPTDILAEGSTTSAAPKQVESWQKSVGSLSNKQKLKGLVVKKKTPKSTLPAVSSMSAKAEANGASENNTEVVNSDNVDKTVKVEVKIGDHASNGDTDSNNSNNVVDSVKTESSPTEKMDSINVKVDSTSTKLDSSSSAESVRSTTTAATVTAAKPQASSGLGLLGAYSDSESDDSDR